MLLVVAVLFAPVLGVLTYRAWRWNSGFWLMGFRFLAFLLVCDLTLILVEIFPSLSGAPF